MKTPQEIVSEIARRHGHQSWNDVEQPCLCWLCPLLRAAAHEISHYGDERAAAAREEGRREGIEQAANWIDAHDYYGGPRAIAEYANSLRALASRPPANVTIVRGTRGDPVIAPEPERTLTGEAAREFLAEMKRVENLPRDSEEYLARVAFLEECRRIYETDRQKLTKPEPEVAEGQHENPERARRFVEALATAKIDREKEYLDLSEPDPAVTCEGCKRGLERVGMDGMPGWFHRHSPTDPFRTPCTAADAGKETK